MTPTVAVMLKAPRIGAVKTRLAATLGAPHALAIYRQLAERQLHALPPEWPAVIHFDPADAEAELRHWLTPLGPRELAFTAQRPGDLGARLHAAFSIAFATGATAVLVIGGDCPSLDREVLRTAAAALAQPNTDAVLGPAADGGYYLIGLRAPCPEIFTGIAWSTPRVLAQTRERLRAAGLRTHELPTLADVDDEGDWRRAVVAGVLPA